MFGNQNGTEELSGRGKTAVHVIESANMQEVYGPTTSAPINAEGLRIYRLNEKLRSQSNDAVSALPEIGIAYL